MHAVIFDIDGTLLQSVQVDSDLFTQSIRAVLGNVQLRGTWADYRDVSDAGIVRQILEDNALGSPASTALAIERTFCEHLQEHMAQHGPFLEVPGARQFFDQVRQSSEYAVAIATGGWRSSALMKLKSAGFNTATVPLSTSSESPERTRIMQNALSELAFETGSVTYVGDAIWDREAATSLGWNFVAIGPELGGLGCYPASPNDLFHSADDE